jgi:rod shape-determining protein MreC
VKFFKNKLTVIIIVLSVGFLALISYSVKRDKVSILENGVGVALNAVQGTLYGAGNQVKQFTSFILNFSAIKSENEALKKQNSELQNQTLDYSSLQKENESLRAALNFKNQRNEYNYIGCDLIGKSGDNYTEEFIIDKGSNDSIEKGMVLITTEGLVGQITTVGNNWSTFQAISSENIAVHGMVETTNDNSGIVKGYRDSDNNPLAKMYFIPMDSTIKKDDIILTSGLGGTYPKGIRIGYVISVEDDKGKVQKNAVIKPYVEFNKLQEVFVVVPKVKSTAPIGNQGQIKY